MDINARLKVLKRTLARWGMFGSYWLINHLPYPVVKVILKGFIAVGFLMTVRLKQIARESLGIAFGKEKSPQQIEQIIRDCFANLGQGMIEMIYIGEHPHMMKKHVIINGREHLDAALVKGRGVLAVTAHFGNFPLMMLTFAQYGYKTNVLMRKTRDPQIDVFLLEKRNKLGLKTIYTMPRKEAVHQMIRALRNNEIVFVLLDQNFGSEGGLFVEFFGQQAATAPGPIVMAHRTGSPIVPLFIRRQKDDMNLVTIEPEMELEKRDDYDEMIHANVAKITKIIEGYIRKYPHEWGWMHRRWKTKPRELTKEEMREQKEEMDGD